MYFAADKCVWTIRTDIGSSIVFAFDNFRLNYSARDDKVTVYDGERPKPGER